MKRMLRFLLATLLLTSSTRASDYLTRLNNLNTTIPDNDPNGWQWSQTVSGLSGSITHVSVSLSLSGGFNGDLCAYLWHDDTLVVLLNRVGRSTGSAAGYPNTGFGSDAAGNEFTLDDQATQDVHFYGNSSHTLNSSGQLTGTWQPDGRLVDPSAAGSVFDETPRSNTLKLFNDTDPNGLWLLYVADLSPGGESTLDGWGLQIAVVPEPASATLVGLGLAFALMRSRSERRRGS